MLLTKKNCHILIDVKFRLILIEIIFNLKHLKIQTILDFSDVKNWEFWSFPVNNKYQITFKSIITYIYYKLL